jgi:small subunit ribosomal protein S5
MVVVGNGDGVVGMGYGKAREVPNAIEKAVKDAKKNLVRVTRYGSTIPHEVRGAYGAAQVVMIPATPGTGIIAGSAVRAVLESIGVHDILSKSVGGSNNPKNLVKAAFDGVLRLKPRESYAKLRGVEIPDDPQLAESLKVQVSAKREGHSFGGDRGGRGGGGGGDRRGPGGPGQRRGPRKGPGGPGGPGGADAAPEAKTEGGDKPEAKSDEKK